MVDAGNNVTFECCVNVPNLFPMWEINGTEYRLTDLPLNYKANGTNITFRAFTNITLRCFFLTFSNGKIANTYSNNGSVITTPSNGMFSNLDSGQCVMFLCGYIIQYGKGH